MVVKGKKLTQKDYLLKMKEEMKDMTPKEKLEHLWEYYRWILWVCLGVAFVICGFVASIISLNTQLRLSGVLINVDVDPDGYVYLQEGYFERIGGQKGKELVNLRNMQFENPYTTVDQTYALDVQETVVALISAQDMDYMMFDDLALPFFMDPEIMLDLRELFTPQELDALGSAVIKLQMPETGEVIPMAIEISDTAFYAQHMETAKPIYLAFAITTPRQEACKDFWQFIKGGQTDSLVTRLAGTVVDAPLDAAQTEALGKGYFASRGYSLGDDRVELTKQSFLVPEGGTPEDADMVKNHVRSCLAEGSLDFAVVGADALGQLPKENLLDLRQLLSQQDLAELEDALVYEAGVPVAVSLWEDAWLVFGANSARTEECKLFWQYISQ